MRRELLAATALVVALACAMPVSGCGLLVGVDWDRVAVGDGGVVHLPDGAIAPPGYDGGSSGTSGTSGGTSGTSGTSGGTSGTSGGTSSGASGSSGNVTCTPPQITCVLGCCTDDLDPGLPVTVTGGQSNTCATTTTGKVRCWGVNTVGELGRGNGADSRVPLTAYGIPGGATRAVIGSAHGCAIVNDVIGCWGANGSGQLGFDGAPGSLGVEEPGRVQKLQGTVASLAVGSSFSCAVVLGTAYCWGDNSYGQLATDLATYRSSTPLTIAQIGSGVVAVGAGGTEACAVTSDGGVTCWGGTGQNPPTKITGVTGASAVAIATFHKCALAGGTVLCWGGNFYGELGNNSADGVTPTAPTGLPTNVTQMALGGSHSCVIADGQVWCWGHNTFGELGRDPNTVSVGLPALIPSLSGVISIAAGDNHTCAVLQNNTLKCWGDNGVGQLGNGTKDSGPNPVDVTWP